MSTSASRCVVLVGIAASFVGGGVLGSHWWLRSFPCSPGVSYAGPALLKNEPRGIRVLASFPGQLVAVDGVARGEDVLLDCYCRASVGPPVTYEIWIPVGKSLSPNLAVRGQDGRYARPNRWHGWDTPVSQHWQDLGTNSLPQIRHRVDFYEISE